MQRKGAAETPPPGRTILHVKTARLRQKGATRRLLHDAHPPLIYVDRELARPQERQTDKEDVRRLPEPVESLTQLVKHRGLGADGLAVTLQARPVRTLELAKVRIPPRDPDRTHLQRRART